MSDRRPVRAVAAAGVQALAAFAVLAGALAGPATAGERRFAVVVGYNDSDDDSLQPLAYADDDALRYGELFQHLTFRTETLVEMDLESRRLWGTINTVAPTRQRLIQTLKSVRRDMDAARRAGDRPVLYFVYSGHGNYDAEGRGYVHLADGRFTTRDLYHHVIAPAGSDPVILLVDACNAALLVHSRGGSERRASRPSTLRLESYPNVGVILASSAVAEVHEWGRYLSGIFSHEVRSALLGAGDMNDDGQVSFAELAAFVASANDEVKNPTIRLTPYIRPPLADPNLPIVDIHRAKFPMMVRVDDTVVGKAHLVDGNLIRYADFNKVKGQSFWLALPRLDDFVLVQGDTEYVLPEGASGSLQIAQLERRERTVLTARGAGSDYFERTLFHAAYSPEFAQHYLSHDYLDGLSLTRLEPEPWFTNAGAWATLVSGLGGIAAGAGMHVLAQERADAGYRTPWIDERAQFNERARDYETIAFALYGVGTAAIVGSALWFAYDRPTREHVYKPPLSVNVGPGGVTLESQF